MKSTENKEKIYCIFNQDKEDINVKIGKAFEIYLKDYVKTDYKKDDEKNVF